MGFGGPAPVDRTLNASGPSKILDNTDHPPSGACGALTTDQLPHHITPVESQPAHVVCFPLGGYCHPMSLADKKVLVLAADLFEDIELLYPVYRLREENASVTVAGLIDKPVTGKKGHGPVQVQATIEEVFEEEYDALVIPGGFAPDTLRRSQRVLDLVKAFDTKGKPIAFICHAGWVPISAKILKGRRATSFSAIRDDMENAGVDWVDEVTVVDGNLISARGPDDLGPWLKALLGALRNS